MIMVTHQLSSFLTKTSRFIICPPFWSAFTKLWSMQVESIVTVILGVSSKLFLRVNHHKSICRVSKSSTGSFLCGVGRRMEAIITLYCLHGGMSFISIVCICTLLAASYMYLCKLEVQVSIGHLDMSSLCNQSVRRSPYTCNMPWRLLQCW